VRALPRIVARTAHGKTVKVDLIRKGQPVTVEVVVGRLEENDGSKKSGTSKQGKSKDEEGGSKLVLGMTVEAITDDLRKQFKLGAKVRGLVVRKVEKGSTAEQKEIKVGQVIVEAGQKPVFEVSDLTAAVERTKGQDRKAILLRVEDSDGNLRFIALPLK